jgi:hypothetical protein
MLKTVLIGVWIAVVTAGATYVSATMTVPLMGTAGRADDSAGVEEITTEMTSVPMIRGGSIIGYVIIQLIFEADRNMLAKLKLEPKPYLIDAAFRAVYANPQTDFTRLKASDIDALTKTIGEEANKRIGGELVKQVLIQQLNYVRKEDIRTHWIKDK